MLDEKDVTEQAVETGGTFADQIARLTDEQLQVVKQTVNSEAGKREQPDFGSMSNAEARAEIKKRYGFNPGF
jgi:hypothetical protein